MGILAGLLSVISVLGVLALIGVGLVYIINRIRTGEPLRIPLRLVLRVYLHVVIIVGLVIFSVGGLGNLLNAGFGVAFDKEFSYSPVFSEQFHNEDSELSRAMSNESDLEKRADLGTEREKQRNEATERGLDRALKEGLILGVSLTIIGCIIWGSHIFGRRRLQSPEEMQDQLSRLYHIVILVIFSVITIIALTQAVPDTLRYFILEPIDEFDRDSNTPGEPLTTAIVALPIWMQYLMETIRGMRKNV